MATFFVLGQERTALSAGQSAKAQAPTIVEANGQDVYIYRQQQYQQPYQQQYQQPQAPAYYPAPVAAANPLFCFSADTEVRMYDDSTKRMDELEADDWVLTLGEHGVGCREIESLFLISENFKEEKKRYKTKKCTFIEGNGAQKYFS